MEVPLPVRIRKHHLADIEKQVSNGGPDGLPAAIPEGIRDANELLVNAILFGAEVVEVENEPDLICLGCPQWGACNFKD